jgi:hypothetical protein
MTMIVSGTTRLPLELLEYIGHFCNPREVFILGVLLPGFKGPVFARTLEDIIDENKVHELFYRIKNRPVSQFKKRMLLSRAIRQNMPNVVRCMVTYLGTKPQPWDVYDAIKNGMNQKIINLLLAQYPENVLEKMRPICLLCSEMAENVPVFLEMLKTSKKQKKRKGQVRRVLFYIEERKWTKINGLKYCCE